MAHAQADPFDIPIAARPLHFFWVVDTSGSMGLEGKIQSLNTAVREALPHMRRVARENANAQVLIRVLEFGSRVRWLFDEAVDVQAFQWIDLVPGATTPMGQALATVADELRMPPMDERALAPVLALVSDGQPTDNFPDGLERLNQQAWAQKAVRVAIAIGRDADLETLHEFVGPNGRVLEANNSDQLTEFIRWASTVAVKAASGAASQIVPGAGRRPVVALQLPDDPGGNDVW
ncbi:vWA domain-containing protein [Solirubrobacter soli]|uniref:vWA domain-containing protein n=1 Tax=Solirubrobacter soli TaxID=363832 RepID=UPI0003FA7A1A|nr:VWA domain-containing protein [Solirubrobacter soli]